MLDCSQHVSLLCHLLLCPTHTGAEELEKRLLLMQKEQKLIQEEAQEAVLQAAASQPAAMAGAHVEQPAAATAGGAGVLDLNAVQAKVSPTLRLVCYFHVAVCWDYSWYVFVHDCPITHVPVWRAEGCMAALWPQPRQAGC